MAVAADYCLPDTPGQMYVDVDQDGVRHVLIGCRYQWSLSQTQGVSTVRVYGDCPDRLFCQCALSEWS